MNPNSIELVPAYCDERLKIKGFLGFNNGVSLLNDICSTQFSNSDLNITARNMDGQDVEDAFKDNGIDLDKMHKELHGEYGKVTYSSFNYIPSLYNIDTSKKKYSSIDLTQYNFTDLRISQINYITTKYNLLPSNYYYTDYYYGINYWDNSRDYFGDVRQNIMPSGWIASHTVYDLMSDTNNDGLYDNAAVFGIRIMGSMFSYGSKSLCDSYGNEDEREDYVIPLLEVNDYSDIVYKENGTLKVK